MQTARARWIGLGCLFTALCASSPCARAQSGEYSTESIAIGTGGYVMNFEVGWTCDDSPAGTLSAPGEVDLVNAGGTIVATLVATANGSSPVISVTGAGSVSGVNDSILIEGADARPADGLMYGTWTITGPAPGPYTLHLWAQTRSVPNKSASWISTDTRDAGGGGPIGAPTPTPTPTPTPVPSPPSIVLAAPASATAFQAVGIGATASMSAGGRPLASVAIDVSENNGSTWARIALNSHPSSPSDSEGTSYAFGLAGAALVRATATDTAGLSGTSTRTVAVARAAQAAVAISPATATTTTGQGLGFAASGGATGNYSWGGSASGTGGTQTVVFPTPGTYVVTVLDLGNANYAPSPPATATVTVQPPFYTLSATSSAGGTVAGGGSYPSNAQATAVATAGSGYSFTGWTGDVTAASPSISVLMNSNKSIAAHFSPLLSQTISFVSPAHVTTRTPAFTLSVTASSGLPVSLTLDSGPAALASDLVTPEGTSGEVTLTATQPGNAQYLPAQPVVISFDIGAPPPGVLFADDSAATKKSDRTTRTTSYTSGPVH